MPDKASRFKKWVKENPKHTIVKDIQRKMASEDLNNYIKDLREEGLTYKAIGVKLGVSKQAIAMRLK